MSLDFHPMLSGPFLREFLEADWSLGSPMEWILASTDVEVYYVPKSGYRTDPEFYMTTSEGVLIKFAVTGDMTAIYKLVKGKEKSSIDTVVEMDPKHRFILDINTLPINGVKNEPTSSPEQILESLVDYAYKKAKSVENPNAKGRVKDFQVLTYDAAVARFNFLETELSPTDIIPDLSPRTIPVKAGDGCIMKCNYCTEGLVKFNPFSRQQYIERLQSHKDALFNTRGETSTKNMDEGFINVSDLLYLDLFYKNKRTDLTTLEAVRLMCEHLPWLEKRGAFVGSWTALWASRDDFGTFYLDKQRYSTRYFERLKDAGINRFYLGLETAHTEGSFLLDKKITYEQKLLAARLIQNAGIKLKVIVHLGVLGKGVYPIGKEISPENFIPWEKMTDTTSRWVNEVQPYRVLESVHRNLPELPINKLIAEGRLIPYDNPKEQVEVERNRFRGGLDVRHNDFRSEPQYEIYLPSSPDLKGRMVITK